MTTNNPSDSEAFNRLRNWLIPTQALMLLAIFFLLIKVIPVIAHILTDTDFPYHRSIPIPTEILIHMSDFFQTPIGLTCILPIICAYLIFTYVVTQSFMRVNGLRAARRFALASTLILLLLPILFAIVIHLPIFILKGLISK